MIDTNIQLEGPLWAGFLNFVEERALINHKKERLQLEAPWTTDPILSTGKFGNVWRELDRGTRWELQKLRQIGAPLDQMIFILTYRHNLIPWVTEMLMSGCTPEQIAMGASGRPVMHDAIKIWPAWPGSVTPRTLDDGSELEWSYYAYAHYQSVLAAIPLLERLICGYAQDLHELHLRLQDLMPRLGSFKAYECLTSFTYLEFWPHSEDQFVHVGHGAISMLRKLTGDDSSPDNLMTIWLAELAPKVKRELERRGMMQWQCAPEFSNPLNPDKKFTARTFEDCLCEYRKYEAVKNRSRENRPYPDNLGRWQENN